MPLYTDLFENEEVGQGTSKTSTLKPRNSIASIKFPSNLISKDSMKVLQFVKAQAKEEAEKKTKTKTEENITLIQVSQGLPRQVRVAFY